MREVNLRGVDLNLLVLLDALIDARSVTRAAEATNLSQPAMSRALGRLRALLDDPILARGADGLLPTPRARAVRDQLKPVLADIRAILAPARFDPLTLDRTMVFACTDHQTIMLLPRLMARVSREAPRLNVTAVPFLATEVAAVRDGRVDLAFGIAEQPLGPNLRQQALYSDRFVTVLRSGHPALADWTLERFVGLDHVLVTVLGLGRGAVDDVLDELGLARRIALRLPHFSAALSVVAETDLVVTLPSSIARAHAGRYDLAILEPPFARAPFTVIAIWSEVLDADPAHRWVRALVHEEARTLDGPGEAVRPA